MNKKFKKAAVGLASTLFIAGAAGIGVVSAQGPTGPGVVAVGSIRAAALGLVCSTTNYTDVAAKALNIDSPALRQALVSGKSLEEIATSKQVNIQTVEDALKAAHDADIAQAVKDGLIPQQVTTSANGQSANATPDANQPNEPIRPSAPNGVPIGPMGITTARFLAVPALNEANMFVEASKALSVSCPDMVKMMQGGQSIAQIATSKNIQIQTVIDALVTAEKAAIAENLKEGLISQVQADSESAQAINHAGSFVYDDHAGRPGGPGFGGFPGGFPGGGFPGGQRQPRGGQDGNGQTGPGPNGDGPNGNNPAPAGPLATPVVGTNQ